jgi:hypothetical protein
MVVSPPPKRVEPPKPITKGPSDWAQLATSLGLTPDPEDVVPPPTGAFLDEVPKHLASGGFSSRAAGGDETTTRDAGFATFDSDFDDDEDDELEGSESELMASGAPSSDESGDDDSAEGPSARAEAAGEEDRPRRRRRRGRRGRRRGQERDATVEPRGDRAAQGTPRDALDADLPARAFDDEEVSGDILPAFDESGEGAASREQAPSSEGEGRRRRGRRRRGRGRSGDRAESGEGRSRSESGRDQGRREGREGSRRGSSERRDASTAGAAGDERLSEDDLDLDFVLDGEDVPLDRPTRHVRSKDLDARSGRDDEDVDDLGDGDGDGDDASIAHRNIPSWEEAIGAIIAVNMEARARSPQTGERGRGRGGDRGRGRGRGGRGGRGRGDSRR